MPRTPVGDEVVISGTSAKREFKNELGRDILASVEIGNRPDGYCRLSLYGPDSGIDSYTTRKELAMIHAILCEVFDRPALSGVEELVEALEVILGSGKSGTWLSAVEPLIARFEVAANFGGDAVHNADGSRAMAELIRSMADKLDTAASRATAALTRFRGE